MSIFESQESREPAVYSRRDILNNLLNSLRIGNIDSAIQYANVLGVQLDQNMTSGEIIRLVKATDNYQDFSNELGTYRDEPLQEAA